MEMEKSQERGPRIEGPQFQGSKAEHVQEATSHCEGRAVTSPSSWSHGEFQLSLLGTGNRSNPVERA